VEVCPVDCFYNHADQSLNDKAQKQPEKDGDVGMLVIHPDECIDCGACEPECPVEAIFEESDVPEQWTEYMQLNAKICEEYSADELDKNRVTTKD